MTTKQELLNEVDNLVSEYLGFTTSVYGLKSKPKAHVEEYAAKMRRAVIYKNYAHEYHPNTTQKLYSTITGEYSAQYLFWAFLTETAHLLYWGESEKEATKRAYDKTQAH